MVPDSIGGLALAITPLGKPVQLLGKAVKGAPAAMEAAKMAVTQAEAAAKEAHVASKVFSKEKQALVDMAKGDQKTGVTSADMQAYKDLNKALPDPFPTSKVRGPEAHKSGAPLSQEPHGHVGPVNHIPVRDLQP